MNNTIDLNTILSTIGLTVVIILIFIIACLTIGFFLTEMYTFGKYWIHIGKDIRKRWKK